MTDDFNQNWFNHLDDLEQHYHPDKFFSDEISKPTDEASVKDHYYAPAFTEEADIPEEAQLSIDIYQDEDNLYVITPVAGSLSQSLDIHLDKDILTIKGERTSEYAAEKHNQYIYQECYWGKFSRSVILPFPVLADKIEATLKDNVLKIKLQKADETKKISIKVKEH